MNLCFLFIHKWKYTSYKGIRTCIKCGLKQKLNWTDLNWEAIICEK